MRAVQAPLLRWPGGCFADSYDWRDGLGAAASRPARTGFWGQQDSNRYGLHEFMHTCRAIGCKPYLAADMRSLPARDFYQEIEYCNAPAGNVPSNSAAPAVPNSLAAQRAANGDVDPFNVDLWGVGNESWGCGGNLVPEEYAAMFRRFTAWTPSYQRDAAPLRRCRPERRRRRLDPPPFQVPLLQLRAPPSLRTQRPLLHLRKPHRVCRRRRPQVLNRTTTTTC